MRVPVLLYHAPQTVMRLILVPDTSPLFVCVHL